MIKNNREDYGKGCTYFDIMSNLSFCSFYHLGALSSAPYLQHKS